MAIQKKNSKGRLDKWYRLAKEKGYRARAAFKLIQLNRKYGFLEKSKVLLDLCAAPGSWCQVAAEQMPPSSIIIGVDLVPIRPIPKTITFQSDISSEKCRATIRSHLKTWKADTVLHDGAPNVGTAWVQDAFSQAELVLQAMKLATEFLNPGGIFITKVFRSKDYNALLWIFSQLFDKVEATKPPSSRNVSAEIFVVCRGFKAPKRLDPRILDPRYVFAELLDPTPNNEAKVFNPEKKKRKRDGYEEGNYIQYKEIAASEFIRTTDPISILGSMSRLGFEGGNSGDMVLVALNKLPETTAEVKLCCADLKVLGKKEFKILLRWRLRARETLGLSASKQNGSGIHAEESANIAPRDEEFTLQENMQHLAQKISSQRKKDRRQRNERRRKEVIRLQMHMMPPKELGLEQAGPKGEDSFFSVENVAESMLVEWGSRHQATLSYPVREEPYLGSDGETYAEGDMLDRQLDSLYEHFKESRAASDLTAKSRILREEIEDGEWAGLSGEERSSSCSESEADGSILFAGKSDGKLYKYDQTRTLTSKAGLFFSQDVFKDFDELSNRSQNESEADQETILNNPVFKLRQLASDLQRPRQTRSNSLELEYSSEPVSGSGDVFNHETKNEESLVRSGCVAMNSPKGLGEYPQLDIDIITAEAMTLAHQVATGQRSTGDIVDAAYNKYSFKDRDGLPDWFLDDENRHSTPHRPITAAAAASLKEKLRVLNARPIKKVMEARSRKKFKLAQRLEKLRKKSSMLADEDGMTEKDKAQSIAKLMSKAAKRMPKRQVKVVVARGVNRAVSGRPRGVKGRYKIVDARLKKDVRADKRVSNAKH